MEIGIVARNEHAADLCKQWIQKGHKILVEDLQLPGKHSSVEKLAPFVSVIVVHKLSLRTRILVLAVSISDIITILKTLDEIPERILMDLQDVTTSDADEFEKSHSYAQLQRLLPGAKIVKLTPFIQDNPTSSGQQVPRLLYLYSVDQLTSRTVQWIVRGAGYNVIQVKINP